jgi:signal transduction histidine kinase
MWLYPLIPLLACLLSAVLALAMWARDPQDRSQRLATAVLGGNCLWAALELLWNVQDTAGDALALVRASALGWVWFGPLTLQLFLHLSGPPARLQRLLPLLYAGCGVFLGLTWLTPWMHAGVERTSWGWAYRFGPAYPFFYVFTVSCIAAGLSLGWRVYSRSPSRSERAQTKWLAVGIAFPLVVASLTDGLLPLAGYQPLRLGTLSFAVLGGVVAWSFHRHGYSLLAPQTFAREILETLRDGVALVRFDGYVRVANRSLARLLETRPKQLMGLQLADHLTDCPSAADADVVDRQAELLTFSGRRVPVAVSSSALYDRQGLPTGLVVVVRDLAEIVSLRNRLLLSGRLAAVGELAAGIAHEINNPLAFVRSNLGVLRQNWALLAGELEKVDVAPEHVAVLEDSEALIDESLEGVDRAVSIVRDVRGLSHVGADHRQAADVRGLIEGVLRLAAPQLRSIRLEQDYAETPALLCAPQELQQVFLNLVMNAVQAVDEGGRIRIATACEAGDV